MANDMKKCGCVHHKIVPALLVVFGSLFLLNNYGALADSTLMVMWPLVVIIAGVSKMFSGACSCCNKIN